MNISPDAVNFIANLYKHHAAMAQLRFNKHKGESKVALEALDPLDFAALKVAHSDALKEQKCDKHRDKFHFVVDAETGKTEFEIAPGAGAETKGFYKAKAHVAERNNKIQARLKAKLEARGKTPTSGTFKNL